MPETRPSSEMEERAGTLAQRQTVESLVRTVAARLAQLPEPEREAVELVAALFDVPRHWPLLRANKWIEADVWRSTMTAAAKRAAGAPLAYAVGRANFRHLTLDVDERVLIPRPETELLVDIVLDRMARGGTEGGVVVDVGTGSGAIALALATEGKNRVGRVIATDVSGDAIDVARANAARLGAIGRKVEFVAGDLLDPVAGLFDARGYETAANVVVSNPPYVAFDEIRDLPKSVRNWEPVVALLSGQGGMAATARLVRQAPSCLAPGGLLALEVDARRASLTAELVSADDRYADVSVQLDLSGRERFVLATRRE